MKLLKEIRHLLRFLRKTSARDKELIFYAEHQGYYPNFEGIIRQLTNPPVRHFCYITSDADDPILTQEKGNGIIHAFYLDKLLPFFMSMVKCKVFVLTMTDLHQYHLKRSTHPVHYVYVFHSMVSTHMMYRKGAFDHYDSILCVGPHHNRELRTMETKYGLREKILVDGGYYRLERIYAAFETFKRQKEKQNKKIVLIAPSWGEKNIIESCGEDLTEILLKNNYQVIIRPHPETLRRTPQLIKNLEDRFNTNPDFFMERSISTDDSLLKADTLICDCSGIALEYAFGTERPVLFLDVPHKVKNPDYQELDIEPLELTLMSKIGVVLSPTELDQIPETLDRLHKLKSTYQQEIAREREKHVYAFDHSPEIAANYIKKLLAKESTANGKKEE